MKEAIVQKGPKVEIKDSPIPTPPTQHHVIIRVIVSGSNPKDWKMSDIFGDQSRNEGDDIAGIVHQVGDAVKEFRPGDRVAAFHEMRTPGGSYAEYAVAWEHTTFHIPEKTSFEEAATIPLAAMTSAIGLFQRLALPVPWVPKTEAQKSETPILIYGGASAVGAFAIKLLKVAQLGPVIAVAGRGIPFVESLLDKSKGDVVVDYRGGDDAVVKGINSALNGKKLFYAYDAVSEKGSALNIWKALDHENGKITTVLPLPDSKETGIPDKAVDRTMVGSSHNATEQGDDRIFSYMFFRYFGQGLEKGWFTGHPYTVVPGGLGGVQQLLGDLKAGKASATKYVVRIADTDGVSSK